MRDGSLVKKNVTLYVTYENYSRLQKIIEPKPISNEVDELMEKRIAELENRDYDPLESADYEKLKKEYNSLVNKKKRLEKDLKKRKTYVDLAKFTVACGIKNDLSNLKETVVKMLQEWKGSKEDLHLFITLLEANKAKKGVEKNLEEIRLKTL